MNFKKANEKIETAVVGGYKKIETGVLSQYKKIEDKFMDTFLAEEGETTAEAKGRLKKEMEHK